MLKNLLYLYNDGHNPFPNMKGYGGLGYHLPEYHKVIHGDGIEETAHKIKEGIKDIQRYDINSIINDIEKKLELKADLLSGAAGGQPVSEVDKEIEDKNVTLNNLLDKNDTPNLQLTPDEVAEDIQTTMDNVDSLLPETDEISNIFKKHYNDRMLKAIGKDLKELLNDDPTNDNYNELNTQYKEFVKNKTYKNIENIKEYINSKEELNEFEQLLKDSIDTNEQEIDELMSDDPNLTYDEKIDILKNHELTIIVKSIKSYEDDPIVMEKKDKFYKKYEGIKNIDDSWSKEIAGKPYENYFLTVGNPIIKYIADDENIDVTEDLGSNPLVKADGGEDTCFIDLFSYNSEKNIGYLNEIKDYGIIMTDEEYNPKDKNTYVAIQLTKLEGTSYFVKDDNGYIIKDSEDEGIEKPGYELFFCKVGNDYLPYYITYKNEVITMNPDKDKLLDIKQYNILSSSNVGTVKADLISLINDKEFCEINGITMKQDGEYFKIFFNYKTHPNKDKPYKDEVLTVRIPKNKFKKWNE